MDGGHLRSRQRGTEDRPSPTCRRKAFHALIIMGCFGALLSIYFLLSSEDYDDSDDTDSQAASEVVIRDNVSAEHYLISLEARNITAKFLPYRRNLSRISSVFLITRTFRSRTSPTLASVTRHATHQRLTDATSKPFPAENSSIPTWTARMITVSNAKATFTSNAIPTPSQTIGANTGKRTTNPVTTKTPTTLTAATTPTPAPTSTTTSTRNAAPASTTTSTAAVKWQPESSSLQTLPTNVTRNTERNTSSQATSPVYTTIIPFKTNPWPTETFILASTAATATSITERTTTATEEMFSFPSVRTPPYDVVCVFNHTSYRRKEPMAFHVRHIPAPYCSHLVYSSVGIAADSTLAPRDERFDVGSRGIAKFAQLKRTYAHLSVLVHVGGQTSDFQVLNRICGTQESRATFTRNIASWLQSQQYDGVVLDWRHYEAVHHSKSRLNLLIDALRIALGPSYTVWLAIPHDDKLRAEHFDLPRLATAVDSFLFLFESQDDSATATSLPDILSDVMRVRHSLTSSKTTTTLFRKFCFALPISGRTYALESEPQRGVNAKASGPGTPGPYTGRPGSLAYYEICSRNWTTVVHGTFGSYVADGKLWVGYLDTANIEKVLWMVLWKHRASCISIWDITLDDFRGECGKRFPLTRAVAGWKSRNRSN